MGGFTLGSRPLRDSPSSIRIVGKPKEGRRRGKGGPFAVYDEDTFQTGTLFVTTFPVMTLDTEYIENDDGTERMYGRMTLFDTAALPGSYVQEPMDFKTLDLDPENNFLVQIKTWAEDSDFWGDLEENGMTELECGEFVIDGNHAENLEEVYEVLLAYKKWMEQEESGELKISPDRENLYLLDIFLMMITGVDNSEKNQFMVFSRKEDGSFQVRKLPWDMDATFGQNLDYITYEGFDSIDTGDSMVEVLKEIEPEMTGQGLKETYWRLRTTVLQEEHIQEIIESLYARLEESGALLRENAAWDKEFGREQTEFVKDVVTRRFQWMDTYYFSM